MKVAVGVITDSDNRILVTQRPLHVTHGGLWEFPGGKLNAHETAEHALARELKEELGILITDYELLGELEHTYPGFSVNLIVFQVRQWLGTPSCLEGQLNMQWMLPQEINSEHFPAANKGILDLIWTFHTTEV